MKLPILLRSSLKIGLFAALSCSCAQLTFAAKEQQPITESMAAFVLKQLNAREHDAYERYSKATTEDDIERIKGELQLIVDGYERLVGENPDYAPGLVSFGMMLHRIGERKASAAILIKADEIDTGLPIVKNQLGNYQAEEGNYNDALGFYILARDLAPKEPLYPFQIGNLLVAYRVFFIDDKIYTPAGIDDIIQDSFRSAAVLDPDSKEYRLRYAQSFFDIENPRWELALEEWHKMQSLAENDFEKQLFLLYTAKIRYELQHINAAKKLLKQIDDPNLDESKQGLLDLIKGSSK